MKRVIIVLVLSMFIVVTVYSASITVTKPNGGTFTKNSSLQIVWIASGITGNVKINLRKADGSGGSVIQASYPANKSSFSYSLASITPGKYFIKIKQGKIFGKSSVFVVTDIPQPKPYIKVLEPSGGNFIKGVNKINISWKHIGIKTSIKIELKKFDNSWGKVLLAYISPTGFYGTKLAIPADAKAGKYYIIVKSSKVLGKSAFFTISEKSSSNNNGIRQIDPNYRSNTVSLAEEYKPKQYTLNLKKKEEVNIKAYGKLTPSTELADFGSTVNIEISFKNAVKVKVYNKKTKKEIYTWSKPKPGGNMVTRPVRLDRIDTAIEMEVWGSKDTHYANCFITARPVVNDFRIEDTAMYKVVHYSFSGCEYAYLKKFDTNKNTWVRVYKLKGDGYINKGIFPKKGKIKLVAASKKRTRYVLVLIGELKQGMVNSKEIEANFWTNQFTK